MHHVNTIRNQVVIPVLNSRRGEFSYVNSPSFSRDVIAAMLADESKRSVTRSRTFPYCYCPFEGPDDNMHMRKQPFINSLDLPRGCFYESRRYFANIL